MRKLSLVAAFALLGLLPVSLVADPGDLVPAAPVVPKRVFNLKDFGAVADGKTPATEAFKAAIAAVKAAGGGTLVVPAGEYFSGPFELCGRLEFRLEKGVLVKFSQKREDYELPDGKFRALVSAKNCDDLHVSGEGVLDGQGEPWWVLAEDFKQKARAANAPSDTMPRPRLFVLESCNRVRVEGITLQNSPQFQCIFVRCQDVVFDHVKVFAPEKSVNTDGIDPSISQRIVISNCVIDTGDDNIAVKSGGKDNGGVSDLLITDCTFRAGHGCSVGSETNEGVRRMTVRRCTFEGTDAGVRLKSPRGKGGPMEDILYTDLVMKGVQNAIVVTGYYPDKQIPKPGTKDAPKPFGYGTPQFKGVTIRNVVATGGTKSAGLIMGVPEFPAQGIVLENVSVEAPVGLRMAYAKGVKFKNVKITAAKGEALMLEDGVEGFERGE